MRGGAMCGGGHDPLEVADVVLLVDEVICGWAVDDELWDDELREDELREDELVDELLVVGRVVDVWPLVPDLADVGAFAEAAPATATDPAAPVATSAQVTARACARPASVLRVVMKSPFLIGQFSLCGQELSGPSGDPLRHL